MLVFADGARVGASIGCVVALLGCVESPEQQLIGHWEESGWAYEKLDAPSASLRRSEGIRIEAYEGRSVALHEAESWDVRADGSLQVTLVDGSRRHARWRLKGRGHVLTLRYADGSAEVYDVKDLDATRMTLHFDLGVEARGIARLSFRRAVDAETDVREASL